MRSGERREVTRLLDSVQTLTVDGCEPATLNVRHFPMMENLVAPFSV
jgi:hypothetical protein